LDLTYPGGILTPLKGGQGGLLFYVGGKGR